MAVLYGLKTCDTCRKAEKALRARDIKVVFRDVRDEPLEAAVLKRFSDTFGGALVNTRSTTWRGLSDVDRVRPALELLLEFPALMKRPVIEIGDVLTLGWDKATQAQHLG